VTADVEDLVIPILLSDIPPREACLSELRLGDLVKFRGIPPVIILGSERDDIHQIFMWLLVDREGVSEGRGLHDVGQVLLLARAEQVPATEVRRGDILVEPDHASPYQLIAENPREIRPGLLDIPWRAGQLPTGNPHVIGCLQRYPSETVLRAPRGWTR
jgi:hypothetical protein